MIWGESNGKGRAERPAFLFVLADLARADWRRSVCGNTRLAVALRRLAMKAMQAPLAPASDGFKRRMGQGSERPFSGSNLR